MSMLVMRKCTIVAAMLLVSALLVAAKAKTVSFGRWFTVKWMVGPEEKTEREFKVRALLVNGEAKEFTTGDPHDITDGVFVVQRAVRLNDSLQDGPTKKPEWTWRPAGWLMVQKRSAHISNVSLPDYDPYSSSAMWYRDYVAYCGISDAGDKVYAMVVQIGRRKPLVRKLLGAALVPDLPDSECVPPQWQKQPSRVTFQKKDGAPVSFEVRSFASELSPDVTEGEPE